MLFPARRRIITAFPRGKRPAPRVREPESGKKAIIIQLIILAPPCFFVNPFLWRKTPPKALPAGVFVVFIENLTEKHPVFRTGINRAARLGGVANLN